MIGDAQQAAARPPDDGRAPPPRWTLRRLVHWVGERFGRRFCRETVRAALYRLKLSWKKARKLLGRGPTRAGAKPSWTSWSRCWTARRATATCLVYIDEAHVHQDAAPGYGWSARGERAWVCSSSPGLSAKRTFYGPCLYTEGEVRLWPYPRGNGAHTVEVLGRLRAEFPERKLVVLWDGVSYHRAGEVRHAAADLDIECRPLPGYSPDFMPVEALWRWLREDVTYLHCHASLDGLETSVADFQDRINQDPIALADRLALQLYLDSDIEKLRISK